VHAMAARLPWLASWAGWLAALARSLFWLAVWLPTLSDWPAVQSCFVGCLRKLTAQAGCVARLAGSLAAPAG